MTDIPQMRAGAHLFDAAVHALARDLDQAPRLNRRFADKEHAAGVAVESIFDNRDIDIDDVAFLQAFLAGYAVTHLVVDGGADRSRESFVVERRRNRLLFVDAVVVAEA